MKAFISLCWPLQTEILWGLGDLFSFTKVQRL